MPKVKDIVVKNLEETGYPFAECYFDSFVLNPESFSAKLFVEPHDKFVFDTVALKLQTKIRRVFIKNYLGVKAGKTIQGIVSEEGRKPFEFVDVCRTDTTTNS